MKHLITLENWSIADLNAVLDLADRVKSNPEDYLDAMRRKTLLMIFEKPSLRTRVSFETGATQMGGHAIFYDLATSPLSSGKENVADLVRVVSRYVDIIMGRLFEQAHIEEMANLAGVPVINALTNYEHPCQILTDLQTIREKKGALKGLKLAYLGDGNNNVTHSLLFGCAKMGMHISVGCPKGDEYEPLDAVLAGARRIAKRTGSKIVVTDDAALAARDADVVYTDSWMSYHIPQHKQESRIKVFTPYQVNAKLMKQARKDAIFMNCLPAVRGCEQTAEVIDGPQSVVFDQAENRLHAQKAVMLKLLESVEE
ncbi:MAG: ornithine carbamoyltransferase [Kiritimatiellae bacterium]|nr:ornithine carbamoyltransferase [Kiritimatiellia bacterium]MCO5061912.1 ornithine carbamoyltransferase [Kiritimatiellia bacterium]MCO5067709.1 ornithine carbamoyltransferase [Kiritimatiellia bacterium]